MANQASPRGKVGKKTSWEQDTKHKKTRSAAEISRQLKIQKALYEIATAASAMTDMQEFYTALHQIVGKLMYARNFYVTLYDPATQTISAPYFTDEAGDVLPPPAKLEKTNRSLRAYVLHTGKTLHVSAEEIEDGRRRGEFTPMGTPAEDWIGVPLKIAGKTIGSLTIQSYKKGIRYKDQHVQVLEFVAQHIAVALTRARAIEETRLRNTELKIINSVQEGLASKLDMQAIYELVGEKIRHTFNAQVVSIDTIDRATQLLHSHYYFEGGRILPGTNKYPFFGFRKYVIENRQPIIINRDMSRWIEEYDNPVILGSQPKSAIFVPMIVGDEAIGVISLQNVDLENAFTEADLRLLTTLANSMGVALENARLWEQEKLYRKALQRELEIGREIQAGFLPEALPVVKGWEIAALLMSAREVAGDFYDAFELPDGNIGLVVADVCDKGVGAALFMTLFRSLIRAAANLDYFEQTEQANAPHSAAERLQCAISLTNNYIAETHGKSGMFATLFFGILDPCVGVLTYINGGHLPPLIVHSGNVRESLCKSGPALGVVPGYHFDVHVVQMRRGDMLFAYTDGAPDAEDLHGESFGYERFLDLLQRDSVSSHELIKTIETELHQYIAGSTQFDDITLLAMRWVP